MYECLLRRHLWGDDPTKLLQHTKGNGFDVIIMSDLLYELDHEVHHLGYNGVAPPWDAPCINRATLKGVMKEYNKVHQS